MITGGFFTTLFQAVVVGIIAYSYGNQGMSQTAASKAIEQEVDVKTEKLTLKIFSTVQLVTFVLSLIFYLTFNHNFVWELMTVFSLSSWVVFAMIQIIAGVTLAIKKSK
jgi:hypothetical protein